MDSGFQILDSSLFTWNLDSAWIPVVRGISLSSIPNSKVHLILQARISWIPDSTRENYLDSVIQIPFIHGSGHNSRDPAEPGQQLRSNDWGRMMEGTR